MIDTEKIATLERDIERARFNIEKTGVVGGGKLEGIYGELYQQLVRAGARPQLKRKYRY